MTTYDTHWGTFHVGRPDELYAHTRHLLHTTVREHERSTPPVVGLTGGSTPHAFYTWLTGAGNGLDDDAREQLHWSTSDERWVPLDRDESNFGTADRMLLQPLGIAEERKHPWPVDHSPEAPATIVDLNEQWRKRFDGHGFDLCLLGMGDDGHTASLFPHSPLLDGEPDDHTFTLLDVPGKRWRLTITPAGLRRCTRIAVMVTGTGKAARLREVLTGMIDPREQPVQLLKNMAGRTTWLVDEDAAAEVDFSRF